MSKQMNIFQARPVSDEFENKISAVDYYNDNIYTGDEKGYIYRNAIQYDQFSISTKKPQKFQISKGKIESIKVLEFSGNLLVLQDGCLYHVDSQTFKHEIVHKKNVCLFEVNYSKKNQILVIERKEKRGYIYILDNHINIKAVEQLKTSSLPTQPSQIQFLDNYIYFAFNKREYQRMDISTKDYDVEQVPIQIPNTNVSFISVTGPDEILFHTQNSLGIFIGRNNSPVEKNNLLFTDDKSQILFCKIVMPYIVIAYDKIIKVYNLQNGNQMQDIIPVQKENIKCMSISGNKLFYGTSRELIYLELTPFENLIKKHINAGKIEEAFSIFNSNVDKNNQDRNEKLEQFYMDASWGLIKLLKWGQARDMIIKNNLNMDIREIIQLYHDLIPTKKKLIPESTRNQTMGQLILQQLQTELKGNTIEINSLVEKEKARSEQFLAEIIENFRQQNMTLMGVVSLKETITFKTSPESINGAIKGSVSLEEIREIVDFVLIRIYIKLGKTKNLKDLLYKGDLMCKGFYAELEEELQRKYDVKDNHQIIAIFYESFGQIKESLDTWKKVGENMSITDQNVIDEACENTIKILKTVKDRNLIKQYLKWVLRKNYNIGSKLFIHISENVIPPDQMFDFFINDVYPDDDKEKDQRKRIKEKYLEILVFEKNIEEERFHTKLALCYIEETLFNIYPKSTKEEDVQKDKTVDLYRQKLLNFLESPSAKFNSSTLLSKIENSWLFTETLFLYGKEKKHKEALLKLVYKSEYELAEKYCEEKTEKLLTNLFQIYVSMYEKQKASAQVSTGSEEEKIRQQRKVDNYKQTIYNFMNKYATHSQLDQVLVLKHMPSDCILADSGEDDGLYSFISAAISHTLHEKRSLKSAHNLSKMDELNVKCQLVKTKKAYIKIQQETKCQVCNKGIGDKPFVVYPNGVVAHFTCVQNQESICPKTGQDFQKTFRGL